jgi:SAM-dependent methyltransferase
MNKAGRKSRFWNLMAFFYEQFFRRFPPHRRLFKEILENVGAPSSSAGFILDAGCGPGLLSLELARQGHRVLGIDRSAEMIKRAQKNKRQGKDENLLFLQGDLNEGVGVQEDSLRRVLMIHSLYLMDDPGRVLRNLARALAADGEIILCNPSRKLTPAELWAGGKDFLGQALREKGPLSIFFFLPIVLVVGGFHFVIQYRKKRTYHCWEEKEFEELLKASGLRMKWSHKSCMGSSHLIFCAVKGR